ncbi:16S rRNA (cytosine967-C5)-methyltransferase [Motilibacter peucedani]|uniref:16S rRNA (Cytosine967-C5)-methyltransferase n=1 Tax=Motilibacter peucedani TaxID=598650 RepID=A0A420XSK5_9ACTN|nr:transcription antitermination factor NusB [Motilibacter peucedani]RKS77789.1 16S rRNA (cytosine967-C5)-methyltransferase [Motilibacter peucedani]
MTGAPAGPRRGAAGGRRRTSSSVDPARLAAYDVLRAVGERDAYANLVLPGLLRERGITGRDAALATELAYGSLRGTGTYDAVVAACVDRPLGRIDPPVLDALRLGAHQLLGTRVPTHAAVSTSVELVRAGGAGSAAGFVNAVLRKVGRRDLLAWVDALAPAASADPLDRLALLHAHPRWVVEAFRDALGGDLEATERALAADNVAPHVTLAVRPGRATRDDLDPDLADGRWSPWAAVLGSGDPGAVPAVRSGAAGVQDEGSQLVALALAGAPLDGPDARWLDGCAGPGGKAALLTGLAAGRGARVLAVERAPHRARLVAQTAGAPFGDRPGAAVVAADSTSRPWAAGTFDRALVDVPCSGLGALRRRPESRWRRTPDDVAGLADLQRALLGAALDAVRSGGVVAYATCSPHPAETRAVVADVLTGRDDVERLDARAVLDQVAVRPLPSLGDGPDVQLWPHLHGTDAMFVSLLRKR